MKNRSKIFHLIPVTFYCHPPKKHKKFKNYFRKVCLKIFLKQFFPTLFACLWIMFYAFCFDNVWKRHTEILLKLIINRWRKFVIFFSLFFIRNNFWWRQIPKWKFSVKLFLLSFLKLKSLNTVGLLEFTIHCTYNSSSFQEKIVISIAASPLNKGWFKIQQ